MEGSGDGAEGGAHGAAEGGADDVCDGAGGGFGVVALGIADFAARVSAVSSEGELSLGQIVHAKVEELKSQGATTMADWDKSVDAEVHVSVRGKIIMSDGETVKRRKETSKVLRR